LISPDEWQVHEGAVTNCPRGAARSHDPWSRHHHPLRVHCSPAATTRSSSQNNLVSNRGLIKLFHFVAFVPMDNLIRQQTNASLSFWKLNKNKSGWNQLGMRREIETEGFFKITYLLEKNFSMNCKFSF
jgi:hypothetical protein